MPLLSWIKSTVSFACVGLQSSAVCRYVLCCVVMCLCEDVAGVPAVGPAAIDGRWPCCSSTVGRAGGGSVSRRVTAAPTAGRPAPCVGPPALWQARETGPRAAPAPDRTDRTAAGLWHDTVVWSVPWSAAPNCDLVCERDGRWSMSWAVPGLWFRIEAWYWSMTSNALM